MGQSSTMVEGCEKVVLPVAVEKSIEIVLVRFIWQIGGDDGNAPGKISPHGMRGRSGQSSRPGRDKLVKG